MYTVPRFFQAESQAAGTDCIFWDAQDLSQVFIGKAVLLGLYKSRIRRHAALVLQERPFFIGQLFHLFNEIGLDHGTRLDIFYRCPFAQGFIHFKIPF